MNRARGAVHNPPRFFDVRRSPARPRFGPQTARSGPNAATRRGWDGCGPRKAETAAQGGKLLGHLGSHRGYRFRHVGLGRDIAAEGLTHSRDDGLGLGLLKAGLLEGGDGFMGIKS